MNTKEREDLIASLNKMTKEELKSTFAAYLADAAEGIERACIVLTVWEARGWPLPQNLPNPFPWRNDIANGALSAKAAWQLGGTSGAIETLRTLPVALQDELAAGKKVEVAVRVQGRIQKRDMMLIEMSRAQMNLAFSAEHGVTPIEEQQRWMHENNVADLSAEQKVRIPKIKAVPEHNAIKVGNTEVPLSAIRLALGGLGYELKPIYGANGIKARVANV